MRPYKAERIVRPIWSSSPASEVYHVYFLFDRLQHGRNELQNELQHVENGTQLKTCHSESLSLQCFLNNVVIKFVV